MYINSTELATALIYRGGDSISSIIADQIRLHDITQMNNGVNYYNGDNDIKLRQMYYISNGTVYTDDKVPNNRIAHPWFKLMVDQKINHLLGKPITITSTNDDFDSILNDILDDQFDDDLFELAKKASCKGSEWLHVYLDDDGQFCYQIIPAEEVIASYDDKGELEYLLRYYDIDTPDGKVTHAELWDRYNVRYYVSRKGRFEEEQKGIITNEQGEMLPTNTLSHITITRNQQVVELGWGKIPFIQFRNNKECHSDLRPIKTLIDEYDKTVSNRANNIDAIQQAVTVIKGYPASDPNEVMQNLRNFKCVLLDNNGDIHTLTTEIPNATIEAHLDRLKRDIFELGQGYDPSTDKFGQNPSGVALKFLFQPLERKCNAMERRFTAALRELIWFIAEYLKITQNKFYDYKEVRIRFNTTTLSNDKELIENLNASKEMLSTITLLSEHPFVDDVQRELEQLLKEGKLSQT